MSLLKTKPLKKKERIKHPKSFDLKHKGDEPQNADFVTDENEYAKALGWYAYFGNAKVARQYAIDYCEKRRDAENLEMLNKATPVTFAHHMNVGYFCRMIDRGCTLPKHALEKIDELFQELPELVERQFERAAARPRLKRLPAVEVMLLNLERMIDGFRADNDMKIDMRAVAAQFNVPAGALSQVGEYYGDYLTELDELVAIDERKVKRDCAARSKLIDRQERVRDRLEEIAFAGGSKEEVDRLRHEDFDLDGQIQEHDESYAASQLLEAYAHLDPKQRLKLRDLIKSIVDGAGFVRKMKIAEKAATAKPKTPKAIPAERQTAVMHYQKSDDSLKLVSLSPAKMIGKKVVWAWHSKYKKIICWESDTGFQAAGQSLKNVDRTKARTVKKPEKFFEDFKGNAKRKQIVFDSLNTTVHPSTPRMSEHHLILFVE